MTSREFSEWQAYARINPFGEWRADIRSAIVASTTYNMLRGPKAESKAPKDFMPDFRPGGGDGEQSLAEMTAYLDMYRAVFTPADSSVSRETEE